MIFRKTIVTGLLSLAALSLNALPSMARPATVDPQQTAGINMRSGPSMDSRIITGLTAGSPVTILKVSQNGWYYVQTTGVGTEGWISSQLTRLTPTNSTYGSLVGEPDDVINIRSAPTTSSSILHTGVAGDVVSLGRSSLVNGYRWYVVVYPNGSTGWVRSDLISVWRN